MSITKLSKASALAKGIAYVNSDYYVGLEKSQVSLLELLDVLVLGTGHIKEKDIGDNKKTKVQLLLLPVVASSYSS